jgi:hypothetical protein
MEVILEVVFKVDKDMSTSDYIDFVTCMFLSVPHRYRWKDGRSILEYLPDPTVTYYIVADTAVNTIDWTTEDLGDGLEFREFIDKLWMCEGSDEEVNG